MIKCPDRSIAKDNRSFYYGIRETMQDNQKRVVPWEWCERGDVDHWIGMVRNRQASNAVSRLTTKDQPIHHSLKLYYDSIIAAYLVVNKWEMGGGGGEGREGELIALPYIKLQTEILIRISTSFRLSYSFFSMVYILYNQRKMQNFSKQLGILLVFVYYTIKSRSLTSVIDERRW